MKRSSLLYIFISILSLSSCTYDYDINRHFEGEFKPKVVLNSLINPDSLIQGYVLWTKHVDDDMSGDVTKIFKKVDKFQVRLYEDEYLIFDAQCVDGFIETNIYPKEGFSYTIELDVPEYGLVRATTNIPTATTYTSSFDEVRGVYSHYTMDNFVTTQKSRALWVRAMPEYSDGTSYDYGATFNIDNPYCDRVNGTTMYEDVVNSGSVICHWDFLRIAYKNITSSLPLDFSLWEFYEKYETVISEDEFGYPVYDYIKLPPINTLLMLITPSDDYDKYYKDLSKQSIDELLPIFSVITYVHSNIENGLGIFAGYVAEVQKYEIEQIEEDE